jgi:drug/metabolite transporter (DMT)-like permease
MIPLDPKGTSLHCEVSVCTSQSFRLADSSPPRAALGDVLIYKKSVSLQIWGCLALMLVSAVAGASTDVRFTWKGYGWQIVNCVFTSAYALYLRSVMDRVKEHTTDKQKVRPRRTVAQEQAAPQQCTASAAVGFGRACAAAAKADRCRPARGHALPCRCPSARLPALPPARAPAQMDEFSMVYYNNLLSIPPILGLMWYFGEFNGLLEQPALKNPAFLMVSTLGGIIGFGISFSSLWYLSQTSATVYSLVGALNKIPVAVVGILAFAEPTNPKNVMSIGIGLAAGVLFARAKK